MATGNNDVSRGRNYHGPSRKEHDRYRSEVKQRNGCHAPSSMCAVIDMPFEHQKAKKGSKLHREKKRKISPVIWDSELKAKKSPRYGGKDVKVLLEKRIIPASIISAIDQSQSRSSSDVSDGCFSRSPASPKQGFGCKLLSLSPQDHMGESSVEDGELVQEYNISKSRWASDDETPGDMSLSEMDGIHDKKDDLGMSPEGGEFQIGRSDPWHGSSGGFGSDLTAGSGREEAIENTGVRECQGTDVNEDNYLNNSDSKNDLESSEVKETMSFTRERVSMLDSCRSVFEYERLNRISEGTYGVVFRAKDTKSGEIVAMKKVKMNKEDSDLGFPLSALREINILLSMNHPSIVTVKEVVMGDLDNVFMVMEYMEHDLKALMEMRKRPFSTSEIKCVMLQLLDGVKYLHDNWVLHRDLKTSNLLMNNKGELKICDLGLSRHYGSPLKPYTPLVVTMWYRAPELLLGAEKYSTAIDMWSVGCIMAELLANEPLFKGRNEVNQLDKIFRMLGTPNEKIWPGFLDLPGANANFVKQPYNLLRKKFPAASFTGSTVLSESGFDLLNRLLTYDPEKRITADEALNHTWFRELPLPTCKELMPTFPPRHAAGR